jgi:hypothetical protein
VEATCPHTPRASLRSQGRSSGLALAGLCAADRDAVEGFPWPGRPRGWAQLGSRSPGLPLAAAVSRPWKATQGNRRALLHQGQAPSAPLQSCAPRSLDTRALRLASRRKDGKHKLQRPAAYRPGERSARFSPPPLETQRPWEAQPPLRVAAAHSPQKKPSGKVCLFLFLALRA